MSSHSDAPIRTPSFLTGCARREPCQRRGEARVEALLSAAVEEFATMGYAGATMSAIALRAGAPIGSLYQFFPNKEAVARAVRTRHIEDVEACWAGQVEYDVDKFVGWFVDVMLEFVDGHPAFLALQDAPASTQPIGPRNRLRTRLTEMLSQLRPARCAGREEHVAETVLLVNRAMMGMYARAAAEEREWVEREYRMVLRGYLLERPGSHEAKTILKAAVVRRGSGNGRKGRRSDD